MLQTPANLALDMYARSLEGKPCREIELEDCPAIPALIPAMATFCRIHDGVGLAAPQVGLYVRMAILMVHPGKVDVLINPEISNLGGRDLLEEEGCLSVPDATARIWRSEFVEITSGTLEDPHAKVVSKHKGLEARVIQHEIDHLNGVFFLNRCGPVSRQLALRKYLKFRQGHRHGCV